MKDKTLSAVLDSVSTLDTEREQIEYLPLDSLESDKGNFYRLSDLDNLASAIALCGLQQPIRVRVHPDKAGMYIILSGHRRTAALWKLVEEGRQEFRMVKCIVERCIESPELTQLKLIFANSATRELTSAEKSEQIKQTEDLLYKLKEQGMEFPGRMRDHVAEVCRTSKSKIARLKVIDTKLIPDFKKQWEQCHLNESPAYALAQLPEDVQRLIFAGQRSRTGSATNAAKITEDHVKLLASAISYQMQTCDAMTCPDGSHCIDRPSRLFHAAECAPLCKPFCRGCCFDCSQITSCSYVCAKALGAKRKKKEIAKQAEADALRRRKEADAPKIAFIKQIYLRCAARLNVTGADVADLLQTAGYHQHHRNRVGIKDRLDGYGLDSLETISFVPVCADATAIVYERLVAVAELLQCSTDYLLGLTDLPNAETAAEAAGGWQTGTPPKAMYCVVRLEFSDGLPLYIKAYYNGQDWMNIADGVVTQWIPVVEESA